MKKLQLILTGLALTALAAVPAFAADETADTAPQATKELHNQTNCPVMGGVIDSTIYTDIQGQRVYHCCPMCSAKLKADPDKYFEKASANGVLFENIQTNCPVSGMKLAGKEVYTDYNGRRIYFCCNDCPPEFAKDPQKYLNQMDNPADSASSDMPMGDGSMGDGSMSDGHMDHGGDHK